MPSSWSSLSEEILINVCSKLYESPWVFHAQIFKDAEQARFEARVAACRAVCRNWAASVPHGVRTLCVNGDAPPGYLLRTLSGLESFKWFNVNKWAPVTAPSVKALKLMGVMPRNVITHVVESFLGIEFIEFLYLSRDVCLDLSPLSSLARLRSLVISSSVITGLESLCNVTSLAIESATGIPHLPPRLESLRLGYCAIRSMEPVGRLSLLTSLDTTCSVIKCDLDPVTTISSLTSLNMASCFDINIEPLAKMSSVTSLDLSYCNVYDFQPLQDLVSLKVLKIEWPGHCADYTWTASP